MIKLPEMILRRLVHRLLKWSFGIPVVFLSLQGVAIAAESAEKLVNIADTRALAPGISKWIAGVYNTSYFEFGLLVVITMALMGLVLGLLCDRLVGLLGLNLGKMQHHE
jgi:hypothetical protein